MEKTRRRDEGALDFNGWMLIDIRTNSVLLGGSPWPYSATLNDIEAYMA